MDEMNYVSRHEVERRAREEYVNNLTKDLFGWTIEQKLHDIKPEERYGPVVQNIMKSKEFGDYVKFMKEASRKPEV